MSDEIRRDRLSQHRQVLQRARGHRSGTDDIVAAWSAWSARPDASRVLDLGCGHGTVTLLTSQLLAGSEFTGVEAQEVSAGLCRENMALNGLESRVTVHHADLRSLDGSLGCFDLVTGTPPFMPPGSGVLPKDPQRAAARFELRGGIEEYSEAAAMHLAEDGRVSLVMDGAQDARCRHAFASAGLELVGVRSFIPRAGKDVRYIAYVGRKASGAEPGVLTEETITIRNRDGVVTEEWLGIREALFLD